MNQCNNLYIYELYNFLHHNNNIIFLNCKNLILVVKTLLVDCYWVANLLFLNCILKL
jgi:hypothetical protein